MFGFLCILNDRSKYHSVKDALIWCEKWGLAPCIESQKSLKWWSLLWFIFRERYVCCSLLNYNYDITTFLEKPSQYQSKGELLFLMKKLMVFDHILFWFKNYYFLRGEQCLGANPWTELHMGGNIITITYSSILLLRIFWRKLNYWYLFWFLFILSWNWGLIFLGFEATSCSWLTSDSLFRNHC